MFGFLHCFIGWLARETGYGPTDRTAGMLWIMSGAFSLGSSDSVTLSTTHERLLYTDHMRYIWLRAIRETSVENMWCVGRIFLCIVYTDSNHRDSQI
jgi:hypothetical protein